MKARRYSATMVYPPRRVRFPLILAWSLGLAVPLAAQVAPVVAVDPGLPSLAGVDRSAWLYKGSDIPPDPAWHFGTLANGLRYAVRRNGVPPGQVSVRVRIDAGSFAETDSQRGYAHFIEHLTFRGSRYVADGEAKRVWQRFGATFGADTNAQTSPIATTYKLDLPSATQGSLDESLKILSGMMAAPAIVPQAIHDERPVVLAEKREQPGPQVRFGDATNALFFAGQPLADRSPIGTDAALEAATADSVRAFHDKWYRPERTVVIIAGDLDPQLLEQLVVKNFADWKGIGPTPPDPDFGEPVAGKPVAATAVEPDLPVLLTSATLRPWHFNADTVIFNQKRLVDTLAARLISRRLEQRARAGGSFLQAQVQLDDVLRSANVTMVQMIPAGDDWQAAFKDVRTVIAQAMAAPPTQAEIDRELAEIDAAMRNSAETARVEAGGAQADDMGSALDIRETVTAPGSSWEVFKGARAKGFFTPAAELAATRRLFQGTATRTIVNLHTADPTATAKLAAILATTATAGPRAAAVRPRKAPPLPELGAPGIVTSRKPLPGLDVERIEFANGVRLLLRANESETGRVYVRVRFGGGYGALPVKPSDAWAGDDALIASGIGQLKADDIEAMTAGRTVSFQFGIGDDAFSIAGLTSPADYGEELRLIAEKLEHPGWDPAPVVRARAAALAGYAGQSSSPGAVISRDLDGLLHDGDPRWASPTREQIAAMTPASYRSLWEPLLATGPIEVTVFGDVKADEAIAAVARTLGAIAPRLGAVAAVPSRFPAHNDAPVMRTHDGPANQAAAVIAWPTGNGAAAIADGRQLDVLAQIFTDRLFDKLRNDAGASYSPSVTSQWPLGGEEVGRFIAIGQVPPDKTAFFFTLARSIAADLVAHPVGEDELKRLLGPMKEAMVRASTGNLFWLRQLGGASDDPARAAATASVAQDLFATTPASLQAAAAKYLRPDKDWTMVVVPKGAK